MHGSDAVASLLDRTKEVTTILSVYACEMFQNLVQID